MMVNALREGVKSTRYNDG